MEINEEIPSVGLGTLLRALLAQLEPAVEQAYASVHPAMRSRFYPVMRELIARGRSTVGEIAEAAGVTQPAMTQTIRQMSKDGFVIVEPGEDRRARIVRLSDTGWQVSRDLAPIWRAVASAAKGLEIDAELPLSRSLAGMIAALDERDFAARIAEELARIP